MLGFRMFIDRNEISGNFLDGSDARP